MAKRTNKKIFLLLLILILGLIFIFFKYFSSAQIKSIVLETKNNASITKDIKITLNKPASVYIEFWQKDSDKHTKTVLTKKAKEQEINLLLLAPNTEYNFKVIVDGVLDRASETMHFKTMPQPTYLVHNWVKGDYTATQPLANGLVMLCNSRQDGYIAMVDKKGTVRWYWQSDSLGVKVANTTPQHTIIALLHPSQKDQITDLKDSSKINKLNALHLPIRRGRIGYAGGTEFAEIDMNGKVLWKVKIDKNTLGYEALHHDIRMDKNHHILSFIKDPIVNKKYTNDTLWGDALVKLDTTGKILWKFSMWDGWDFAHDSALQKLSYDRFHLNALYIDQDGNYLLSSALLSQIWKINSKTGKIIWKLGKGQSFKMDSSDYFAFQHDVNIEPDGTLTIFDNGDFTDYSKTTKNIFDFKPIHFESRVLSFKIDTVNMTAKKSLAIKLPKAKYSSRMGSAYRLPSGNYLVNSAKTGTVLVLSQKGDVLWQLDSYFIPYRAEYIPTTFWNFLYQN